MVLDLDGTVVRVRPRDVVVIVNHGVGHGVTRVPLRRAVLNSVARIHANFFGFIYSRIIVERRQKSAERTQN